jgi:hypothetical protein
MEWDVAFDPAFAAEAKTFSRAAQLEIAALSGLLRQFGRNFDGRIATR